MVLPGARERKRERDRVTGKYGVVVVNIRVRQTVVERGGAHQPQFLFVADDDATQGSSRRNGKFGAQTVPKVWSYIRTTT